MWNAYCDSAGTYQPGYTVSIEQGARVSAGTSTTYDSGYAGHSGSPRIEQIIVPGGASYFRYTIGCTTGSGTTVRQIVLPQGAAPVSPFMLRQQATARLTIPQPVLGGSPPLDDPDRFSVVRIPTWLWIDHPWEPLTASAASGGLQVSVTATPTRVVWDTGDGEQVVCDDAGVEWRKGLPEDGTDCSHTYLRSSAGEPDDAYTITASVEWVLTWSLNGTDQGQFDTFAATTAISHGVGEIQAVGTSGS